MQRVGLHVVHNDFYGPIPDTRTLSPTLWTGRSDLVGVDVKEDRQLELLRRLSGRYRAEYQSFPLNRTEEANRYYVKNGYFESVDGEMYHCIIRDFKPRQIIEVGVGHSTRLAASALLLNHEEDPARELSLVAIDPFPTRLPEEGIPGLTEVIVRPVEQMDASWFERLDAGDILFIDSSHVLKIGNDVWFEYLEVIPRLKPGVLVHVHDVFLPSHYRRETVVRDKWFWNEQYLLQAFLAFNAEFEVVWSGSLMHLRHPRELENAFPSYSRSDCWPGSFWFQRVTP